MKICLHIGVHKAASSTIQKNLKINKDIIFKKYGINYVPVEIDLQHSPIGMHFRRVSKYVILQGTEEYLESINEARFYLDNIIDSLPDCKILLLSWEGFLGHSNMSIHGGIYTHHKSVSDSIYKIFGKETSILLLTRRQDEFLESCYLQQMKELRTMEFSEFLAPIEINKLHWSDIIDSFNNIHVVHFESIKSLGTKNFIELCISCVTGIDFSMDGMKIIQKTNASMSIKGSEINKELLPLIGKADRGVFGKIIFRNFSSNKYGKAKFFNDFHRRLIIEVCKDKNIELINSHLEEIEGYDSDYYTNTISNT